MTHYLGISFLDLDVGLCDNNPSVRCSLETLSDMDPGWISVKVHPCAGKDVLVSVAPGRFEAWVRAKPMEGRSPTPKALVWGRANEAVVKLLTRTLQIPRGHLRLMKGRSGRQKVFRIL